MLLLLACADERLRTDREDGHTHVFVVPAEALRSPPEEGVSLTTDPTREHTHTVTISAIGLDLMADPGGIDVSGETSEEEGHTHVWESR